MKNIKLIFLIYIFCIPLFAADCDPVDVFHNLKDGKNYLPFELEGVDRTQLHLVTEFVNQEAIRTGKSTDEIINALKEIKGSQLTKSDLQSALDVKLATVSTTPNSGVRSGIVLSSDQIESLRSLLTPEDFNRLFRELSTQEIIQFQQKLTGYVAHRRTQILQLLDGHELGLLLNDQVSQSVFDIIGKLRAKRNLSLIEPLNTDEINLLRSIIYQNNSKPLGPKEIEQLREILSESQFDKLFITISPASLRSLLNIDSVTRTRFIREFPGDELVEILRTIPPSKIGEAKRLLSTATPTTIKSQLRWSSSERILIADRRVTRLVPKSTQSQHYIQAGVDLNTPIHMTYPELNIDFNLMGENHNYLRSPEYIQAYGDLMVPVSRSGLDPKDLGTSIGGGSFKSAYLSKDGSHVIKVLKAPDPDLYKYNPAGLIKEREELMLNVRRELAIEDFLLKVQERYHKAGLTPPFKVLKINRDPELLSRGIIVQEVASGKSLQNISRSNFEKLDNLNPRSYTPSPKIIQKTTSPLHEEVLDRIPGARELMAIFDRFEDSIHQANYFHFSEHSLGGHVPYASSTGELIEDARAIKTMAVDYGIRLKNLSYNPKGNPPLEFFDW